MSQFGWKIDLVKCIGCHACAIACKAENNTYPQQSPLIVKNGRAVRVDYRRVINRDSGVYPRVSRIFVSMSCNHCAEPACLKSCPVGAITKRESDGIVLIDQELCIGCKYCVWACPYGAPQFNPNTKKVEKCTFCVHRIEAGLKPACVTTCVGRALTYETDFDRNRSGENAPEGFSDPRHTIPSIHFDV